MNNNKQLICSPLTYIAQQQPQQIAIIEAERSLTYQQLQQQVSNLAGQLHNHGLQIGDKVACVSNNSSMMIMLYLACVETGTIFCPINPKFPQSQIEQLLQAFNIHYYLANDSVNYTIAKPLHCEPQLMTTYTKVNFNALTACNIILTSGSSGTPKAAVHCFNNHYQSAIGSATLINIEEQDNWLLSLPLFHIGGLAIVNRCLLAGATITIEDKQQSLAQQITQHHISHLSLVSTQLVRLLKQDPHCLAQIKVLLLGGGAINAHALQQLSQLNVNAFTSYGMTEMSSQISTGHANSAGLCGQVLPQRQLMIKDELIYVRGETLFLGYLKQDLLQLELDQAGWFCTQDRGLWQDGQLKILGRADNMFICGGENIQPEEIEAALKQHPLISEVVVFPVADEEFGLLPHAIIQYKDADSSLTQAELDQFLTTKIARFKRPRQYHNWPKQLASTGLKIQRKQVIAAVTV